MELIESRDGRKLTVTCRGAGIDWEKINEVAQLDVDEWMTIRLREDSVKYTCPDFDPLCLRFESPITAFDFYMIIAQIARSQAILEHLGLDDHDILWDIDYIYMSLNTRELKFVYCPTKRIDNDNTMKNLINVIMYALTQADMSDTYLTEFAFYLKRPGAYKASSIIRYVTEKEKTIAKLLRINEPISYRLETMAKKEAQVEAFEIMDFFNKKPVEEKTTIEDYIPVKKTVVAKSDIGIGDFSFLRSQTPIIPVTPVEPEIEEFEEMKPQFDVFDFTRRPIVEEEEPQKILSNTFATIQRVLTGEEKIIGEDEFYMGKSKKNSGFVITGNSAISRHHALIFKKDGQYHIIDLDSMNHTFVNERKVKIGSEVKLADGDIIKLANERFEFHIIEQ